MKDNKINPKGYTVDNIYDRTNLRVAGWTDYDTDYYDSAALTDEVFFVIAREIKDNGYLFGGDAHQDASGCAPVLNDGTVARFSTRNWGVVMAIAYDWKKDDGSYDYMGAYMDMLLAPEYKKRPKPGVNTAMFLPEAFPDDVHIVMPEPLSIDDIPILYACAETAETQKAELRSRVLFTDTRPEHKGCVAEDTVCRLYRDNTFEDLIHTLHDNYLLNEDDEEDLGHQFGFDDAPNKTELLDRLNSLFPDTKDGVICLIFY